MLRLALALLLATATPAAAHDFWLQPRSFQVEAGAPAAVTIEIGHADDRNRWQVKPERVLLLTSFGPGGRVDQRAALRTDGGPADIAPRFAGEGVHVLAYQGNHALSDLPAIRFNDYAKLEGLTPILDARARAGSSDTPGREIYSRRAKALIQVGPPTNRPDPRAITPVGLSLEIVPERDPYALGADRALPVRVLSDGRPLAGATVKLTNLDFDAKPVATVVTDRAGRARFRIPPAGQWLLNTVWSKPIAGDPRGDFDTTFSSLTFGYAPPRR